MLKVKDVIEICNARLLNGNIDLVLSNFCSDTRNIKENDVYVGIKGENFDGNDFYLDAIKKGAKVCILEHEVNIPKEYNDITILVVNDSIKCLQDLARYKISKLDLE